MNENLCNTFSGFILLKVYFVQSEREQFKENHWKQTIAMTLIPVLRLYIWSFYRAVMDCGFSESRTILITGLRNIKNLEESVFYPAYTGSWTNWIVLL